MKYVRQHGVHALRLERRLRRSQVVARLERTNQRMQSRSRIRITRERTNALEATLLLQSRGPCIVLVARKGREQGGDVGMRRQLRRRDVSRRARRRATVRAA